MTSYMEKLQAERTARERAARTTTSATALPNMLAALGDVPNLDHVAEWGGKIGLSAAWGAIANTIRPGGTRDVIYGGVQQTVTRGEAADREAALDKEIERTLNQYSADAQSAITLGLAQAPRPLADIVDE